MLNLSQLAVDPSKASNGVWVKWMGGSFLIARFNNPTADMLRAQLSAEFYQKWSERDDDQALSEADTQELFDIDAKVMSEAILMDWKDVALDGDKKATEYTPEIGFKVLRDRAYYDLYQFILKEAVKHSQYARGNEEGIVEDVKPT